MSIYTPHSAITSQIRPLFDTTHKTVNNDFKTDKRLKNWQKWMQIRKNYHEYVKKALGRATNQMVCNRSDTYREKVQDKLYNSYLKIETPDPIRGCPSYWRYPCGMPSKPEHCPLHTSKIKRVNKNQFLNICSCKRTEIFDTPVQVCKCPLYGPLTKEQICIVPSLVMIGVPNAILQEKGITMNDCASDQKVSKEITDQKQTRHFKTQFEELCVVGKGITNISDNTIHTSCISPKSFDHTHQQELASSEMKTEFVENANVIVSFKFGDDILSSGTEEMQIKKFYFNIDYLIPYDGVIQNQIDMQNIGNVTINFQWRRVFSNSTDIISKEGTVFAFVLKKMKQKLLLNETKSIVVYFSTNTPGFYEETWELETIPVIPNVKFFLILWAEATFAPHQDIIHNFEIRLEEGIKHKIVDDTMVELLSRIHVLKPDTDTVNNEKILLEKDIFESQNIKAASKSAPIIYYYNKYVMDVFKEIYKEVRQPTDAVEWNLKIDDLETMILNIDDPLRRNGYKCQLETWLEKLLKTNMSENTEREKYAQIYFLLCTAVDQITERIHQMREYFNVEIIETYPEITIDSIYNECENKPYYRIPFFTDNSNCNQYEKQVLQKTCQEHPQLKDTTVENPELLQKLYEKVKYGIDLETIKKPKGKKSKSNKNTGIKGKGKKDTKKNKQNEKKIMKQKSEVPKTNKKTEPKIENLLSLTGLLKVQGHSTPIYNQDETIIKSTEDGNTFSEMEHEHFDLLEQTTSYMFRRESNEYKHSIYLITYELLLNVIQDIELTILSYQNNAIRHQLLKRILDQPLPIKDHKTSKTKSFITTLQNETESIFHEISLNNTLFSQSTKSIPLSPSVENNMTTTGLKIDTYTETSNSEIYPTKTKTQIMQTIYTADIDKEELVDQIEMVEKNTVFII